MLKHLFKILWNQRRQNGWIFAELSLVFFALWLICDLFIVRIYTYHQPLGYNVENCWRLSFGNYPSTAPEYVSDTTITKGKAMLQIMDRMRQVPQVESVCVAFYSSPYSFGNSWTSVLPCSADSTRFTDKNFHRYVVSLDYFDVFRVKDKSGMRINTGRNSQQLHDGILVTPELEHEFFGGLSAVRRSVKLPNETNDIKIAAVTNSIRPDDFKKPEAALIQLMNDKDIIRQSDEYGYSPNELEVTVRMKSNMTQDEMNEFIAQGNGFSAGNLYVNGASSWLDQRDNILRDSFQRMTVFSLIAIFTLLNVFFGITGTFWLRIEQRRAETGLRLALGSTHRHIGWLFTSEGWLLLTSVLPLALVVIFNFCYMELPDTNQMDMSAWRFILGFLITFVLMGTMIGLGSWIPARRAMKLQPAEALHYE